MDVVPPDRAARRADGSRRRRRILLGLALVVVVGLAVVAWLGLGLKRAAAAIQTDASGAQASIEAAKAQLLNGDYADASRSAAMAQSQVADAATAARAMPVRIVGKLPVVGQAVTDLDNLIGAAGDLAEASGRLVTVYGAASGKSATGPKLFSHGRVDFAVLSATTAAVDDALARISDARTRLDAVQGTLPGTHAMASARDKALAQIGPLDQTLTTMRGVLVRLPSALGKGGEKRYLLVTLNPAELYPGGGAALSAALVTFRNGVLSIPLRGSVSEKLFPNNPKVAWTHVAGPPYYVHRQKAAFAYSDLHPDFTVSAVEMERSWVANGEAPVDGVITLDPIALSAALRVTGPVNSPVYGQVTGDNLVQKLLVDAYVQFGADQTARHQLNDQLMSAVFSRLSAGSGALSLAKALAGTAPGHHFRIYVNDPALQKIVLSSGLGGEFPATPGDLVAVFSQNQNGSKVDIFQKRTVSHVVAIKADGSATVTTTVRATYDVPTQGRTLSTRVGYLTLWSFNWYLAYLPPHARLVSYTAPSHDRQDKDDPIVYPAEHGRTVVRIGRWTSAGDTTVVTLVYRLPAGTFGGGSSPLEYRLDTMPQPMVQDAAMTVRVSAPGSAALAVGSPGWSVRGGVATYNGPLNQVASTSIGWH